MYRKAVPTIGRHSGFATPREVNFTACYSLVLRYATRKVVLKFELSETREN